MAVNDELRRVDYYMRSDDYSLPEGSAIVRFREAPEIIIDGKSCREISDLYAKSAKERIDAFRKKIGDLTMPDCVILEDHIGPDLPPFFNYLREAGLFDKDGNQIKTGVIRLGIYLSREELSDDKTVMNFLQWLQDDLDRANEDPTIREYIDDNRESYRKALFNAVEVDRWLPHSITVAAGHAHAKKIKIWLEDIVEGLAGGRYGRYVNEGIGLVLPYVREDMEDGGPNAKIWHELVHGTIHKLFNFPWFYEGVTEHITRSLMYGEPWVMDPDDRADSTDIYGNSRRLLGALADGDPNIVRLMINSLLHGDSFSNDLMNEELSIRWRNELNVPNEKNVLEFINDEVEKFQAKFVDVGYARNVAMGHACGVVLKDIFGKDYSEVTEEADLGV